MKMKFVPICCGLNCLPLNPYVEALSATTVPPPQHTHSETVFGDEASKEVIKLNEVICMGSNPI